jgi:hypothetical protein
MTVSQNTSSKQHLVFKLDATGMIPLGLQILGPRLLVDINERKVEKCRTAVWLHTLVVPTRGTVSIDMLEPFAICLRLHCRNKNFQGSPSSTCSVLIHFTSYSSECINIPIQWVMELYPTSFPPISIHPHNFE